MNEMNKFQLKQTGHKTPIPKLPFIIGGIVVGVAALAVAAVVFLGGGSHEHSFGKWKTVDEPTCLAAGIEERVCDCGDKEMRRIEALGHTEVTDDAVAPTCTATGLTEGKHCSVCNATIVAQKLVDKVDHIYDNASDADCNVCGETRVVGCTHVKTETIPGKVATCTATGLTDGTKCKKCGEIVLAQTTTPKVAHTEVTIPAVEATCTTTGLTVGKKCSVCDTTLVAQQTTLKIAHIYDDKYDATCNKCDFVRDTACAHTETETIKGYAATCTQTGLTDGTKCKKCGEIIVAQASISMKPHTEVIDAAVESACTSTGLTEGKHCSVCNTVLNAQETVAAKGHTAGAPATCTTDQKCTVCQLILVTATSHSYVECLASVSETGNISVSHSCSKCGSSYTESVKPIDFELSWYTLDWIGYQSSSTTLHIPAAFKYNDTWYLVRSIVSLYDCESIENISFSKNSKITSIGVNAFAGCTSLSSIEIPNSVTSIGESAFDGCASLKNITIPDGVTSIGEWAFYRCEILANITFGENSRLTSIGSHAFDCSGLESITIPDGVTSIGAYAFEDCSALERITIPASVKIIEAGLLSGLSSIQEIVLPFVGRSENALHESYQYPFGYIFGKDWYDGGFATEQQYYYVSSSGATPHYETYYIPRSLKSVTITGGDILPGAFAGCSYLESLTLPFVGVSKVDDDGQSSRFVEIFGTDNCTGGVATTGPNNNKYYVPSSLATVVITGGTSIGNYAFAGCSSLKNVVIPNNVMSIGNNAFASCTSLTSVSIPDSVTSIGRSAFDGCSSLTSIEIPAGVTRIDNSAFSCCKNLVSITYIGTIEQWKAVSLGYDWNKAPSYLGAKYDVPATEVVCSDGSVKLK